MRIYEDDSDNTEGDLASSVGDEDVHEANGHPDASHVDAPHTGHLFPATTKTPQVGEPMFVISMAGMLELILEGKKTIEIRHMNYTPKRRWIVRDMKIVAVANFGVGVLISDDDQWRKLVPEHHVDIPSKPYQKTWALPITHVEHVDPPIRYHHAKGAMGTPRFRPFI